LLLSHLHAQARKVTRQQSPKRAAAACTERIAGTKALRVDLGLPEQEVIEGLKAAAGTWPVRSTPPPPTQELRRQDFCLRPGVASGC
jgi:hypothetical protein